MTYRIVLLTDGFPKHFWWQLKSAGNGAVLATSETYKTKRKAFDTASALAIELGIEVEDQT
jgi:uncharacterized protein YegP (UPF0339 family)